MIPCRHTFLNHLELGGPASELGGQFARVSEEAGRASDGAGSAETATRGAPEAAWEMKKNETEKTPLCGGTRGHHFLRDCCPKLA